LKSAPRTAAVGVKIGAGKNEDPREKRTGSILLLDMKDHELWHYVYTEDEERGGASDFTDITGDRVPETNNIQSLYSYILPYQGA
jgi:hypothetical protein